MGRSPGNELPIGVGREPRKLRHLLHEFVYLVGNMVGFSVPAPKPRGPRLGERAPAGGRRRFDPQVLTSFADAPSVEIETGRARSAPRRRMPIRTVVDEDGHVYARAQEGSSEYWYRRILINPGVVLHTATEAVPAYATRVSDEGTNTIVTELYRNKYGSEHPALGQVLDTESEVATVRFDPL